MLCPTKNSLISFLTIENYGEFSYVIRYNVRYSKSHGQDAEFLYDTIDTYIEDAEKANKKQLTDTWRKIKSDKLSHVNLLKDALENEIHGR
jgi:hypothetical protein